MKKVLLFFLFAGVFAFFSCQSGKVENTPPLSPEQQMARDRDSLKKTAAAGDLLVRLGDDILSYQIKFFNEKDFSYSHAGIIVEKDNQKLVAHIAPDDSPKDVVQYIPIDSFLHPGKNLQGALYRYDLSSREKSDVNAAIEKYRADSVRFDWLYDLTTDNKMYCSEMISKALNLATNNRLQFREINVPKKKLPLLIKYFKGQASDETIAARKVMTIDNLYLLPECKRIMQVKLKSLPGQ